MSKNTIIKGVCCQYCTEFEKHSCPVKSASPWSRWGNFCSAYNPNKKSFPDALTIVEAAEKVEVVEV